MYAPKAQIQKLKSTAKGRRKLAALEQSLKSIVRLKIRRFPHQSPLSVKFM